ncbi:MAG: poly-gamma-glutamate biosynthesis protein PgsC [Tissierellales bacterium]|nr:poly-gamma-glutamate biosynthesis protein PgsC [Tissierellales bacterium]MBN2828626.1 poly-gamma-glutamate biosynthesis protein PgsC [Tissierellales bacterium]
MSELLILGLLISLIYTEATGISPGGIIVPAYFAIYFNDPYRIMSTLAISIICVLFIKLISRFTILYGRRKFAVYIILGIVIKILVSYIAFDNMFAFYHLSLTIGYLIPGLLGSQIEKQGLLTTLSSLGIVTLLIHLSSIMIGG